MNGIKITELPRVEDFFETSGITSLQSSDRFIIARITNLKTMSTTYGTLSASLADNLQTRIDSSILQTAIPFPKSPYPEDKQVLIFDKAQNKWVAGNVQGLGLGGDLTGTAANATVAKLKGIEIDNAVPQDKAVLQYNKTENKWVPTVQTSTSIAATQQDQQQSVNQTTTTTANATLEKFNFADSTPSCYSACVFSDYNVYVWGQIDGNLTPGIAQNYKFAAGIGALVNETTNGTNTMQAVAPYNYIRVPFYETYGVAMQNITTSYKDDSGKDLWIAGNLDYIENRMGTPNEVKIKQVIWNYNCGLAALSDGTVWYIGPHDNISGLPPNFTRGTGGAYEWPKASGVTTSPGLPTSGFVKLKFALPSGGAESGKVKKMQCLSDSADATQRIFGVLFDTGNLYVWGTSIDGCFGQETSAKLALLCPKNVATYTTSTQTITSGPMLLNTVNAVNDEDILITTLTSTTDTTTKLYKETPFVGRVIDFNYNSASKNSTSLSVIVGNTASDLYGALYIAGDNSSWQLGSGADVSIVPVGSNSQTVQWNAFWNTSNSGKSRIPLSSLIHKTAPGAIGLFSRAFLCRDSSSTQNGASNYLFSVAQNGTIIPTRVSDAAKCGNTLYSGISNITYIDKDGKVWGCGDNTAGQISGTKWVTGVSLPANIALPNGSINGDAAGTVISTSQYSFPINTMASYKISSHTHFRGKGFFCLMRQDSEVANPTEDLTVFPLKSDGLRAKAVYQFGSTKDKICTYVLCESIGTNIANLHSCGYNDEAVGGTLGVLGRNSSNKLEARLAACRKNDALFTPDGADLLTSNIITNADRFFVSDTTLAQNSVFGYVDMDGHAWGCGYNVENTPPSYSRKVNSQLFTKYAKDGVKDIRYIGDLVNTKGVLLLTDDEKVWGIGGASLESMIFGPGTIRTRFPVKLFES